MTPYYWNISRATRARIEAGAAPRADGRCLRDRVPARRSRVTFRPKWSSRPSVFDKVSFAYDEHAVLHDVSFTIPTGSMSILLGASGAGKSVVLKLMLGLFRPDSGTIHVMASRSIGCRARSPPAARRHRHVVPGRPHSSIH